jgi:hypothetical protein
MASTLLQLDTPLNMKFFSPENVYLLQRRIRVEFKNKHDIAIDYQNPNDLMIIMRSVYSRNSVNGYCNIKEQVEYMNKKVISFALDQIKTGVFQFYDYVRTLDKPVVPLMLPATTSVVGTKIPDSYRKIGV